MLTNSIPVVPKSSLVPASFIFKKSKSKVSSELQGKLFMVIIKNEEQVT
jgi:hypothetical protein